MNVGEMFAGCGGLGMALARLTDVRTVWVAETEKYAASLHTAPNLGDVAKVDWTRVTPVDILTAGFPCQDISSAGKMKGLRDTTRSGLWAHVTTAIDTLRPRMVVIENVRAILTAEADTALEPCPRCLGDGMGQCHLRALGRVLGDLATLGYDARWHSNRASDVGAPHERWRTFIIAHPADQTLPVEAVQAPPTPQGVSILLPTPRYSDGSGGGQRHGKGGIDLRTAVELLPTPVVNDMGSNKTVEEWDEFRGRTVRKHRNSNGHGPSLHIEAARGHHGRYAPAVARWEALFGPAPAITEPGPRKDRRLTVAFTEWMMGLPAGTVDLIPRKPAMKILGNAVVPQQAAAAINEMLTWERP